MNVGFEKIHPVPVITTPAEDALLLALAWDSKSHVVEKFKANLKASLRYSQLGRCCFCRRLLYDDYASHLEHFIDKGVYSSYTFLSCNVSLCCGTCNVKKNGYFKKWRRKFNALNPPQPGVVPPPRCPVVGRWVLPNSPYPSVPNDFRWVNPYLHDYSDHIEIERGWIFKGLTREGRRTITGVRLNDISEIERRALAERLNSRGGRLSLLVGAIAELENHRAVSVGRALANSIRIRLRR